MSNIPYKQSPLTGSKVPFHDDLVQPLFGLLHSQSDGFADFYYTESLASILYPSTEDRWVYKRYDGKSGYVAYTSSELDETFAFIRSLLWRRHKQGLKPMVVTDREGYEQSAEYIAKDSRINCTLKAFEDLIEGAKQLSFSHCAIQTLFNLWIAWKRSGLDKPFLIHGARVDAKGKIWFNHATDESICEELNLKSDKYVVYGYTLEKAPFIYRYLFDSGLLVSTGDCNHFPLFQLSSKGFDAVDKLERGANSDVVTGFFIRRYDKDQDEFLNGVMKEVCGSLGIGDISPVWAEDHNDKIDERIFRLIKQASVVIVDCTGERYNVGLEHGYAMALGKPIVLIREKKDPWESPPFDISTQNCYDYQTDEKGRAELVEKLRSRIGLAVDEIRK